MSEQIKAEELATRLGSEHPPFILDVRTSEEHSAWKIPTSFNIPVAELSNRFDEIPQNREIVVHCATGARSKQAFDILSNIGYNILELSGGMQAWSQVYDTANLNIGRTNVIQVRRRAKGCLSYIIGNDGIAFVVDPSSDVEVYEQLAASHHWHISHIFDTHLHADHLSGARILAARTGATIHLNPADAFDFPYERLNDGDRFALPGGIVLDISILNTPGHTEGSTTFCIGQKALLTGDTLFIDGVGRPDLAERAEEFARNLYRSLTKRLLPTGDDVLVLPAHYGETVEVRHEELVGATIGQLLKNLKPLSYSEPEFIRWASAAASDRPPNYVEIVHANMGRPRLSYEELKNLELGPNQCAVGA